jgi:2-phosphosulfolactate phosphatase
MSTTNGTAAMMLASGAERVVIASWLNLSATVDLLVETDAEPVFLCAGREGRFGLEDAVCAGTLVLRLLEARTGSWKLNDAALAVRELARVPAFSRDLPRFFAMTQAGQGIIDAGLEQDLTFCAQVDRHAVVPVLQDRHLVLAPPLSADPGL